MRDKRWREIRREKEKIIKEKRDTKNEIINNIKERKIKIRKEIEKIMEKKEQIRYRERERKRKDKREREYQLLNRFRKTALNRIDFTELSNLPPIDSNLAEIHIW